MSNRGERASALYTIAAGVPFVDALAAGIRERAGGDPEKLADVTVLLPTRRACRALSEAFLRLYDGRPVLLPALMPLGDVDEDELALRGDFSAIPGAGLDLPPAISGVRRQLLLSRLILARPDQDISPDQAVRLAQELARLLDQVHTERLSFDGLKTLIEDADYAEHWQKTLNFLSLLTESWPRVLQEYGVIDPADRRNRLIDAQAAAWTKSPPHGPIIAAGSTGSIPATADLLKVIAHLPGGAVVLPGLDREATDAVWQALEPGHPQYGLSRLLDHIGVERRDVADWPSSVGAACHESRTALIHAALVPAAAGDGLRGVFTKDQRALEGIQRIEADTEGAEAGAIALILRHTLEEKGRTAALVTPDRKLARRVASELARWGVEADDSAGRPLADTPPGTFMRLALRMVADQFAPVALLAALKHPLATGGRPQGQFRALVRRLEQAVLRGPRPAEGIDGLRDALKASRDPHARDLKNLIETVADAGAPLDALFAGGKASLRDLLAAHVALAESLAVEDDGAPGAGRLWAGEDGEALAGFVSELNEAAGDLGTLDVWDYPALFDVLLAGRVVRPRYGRHPRLFIWGLLEARLQHADVMILGGLNEGTWPPEAEASPWMSRPMLERFGLPSPERRLGLAAHDFVQAFAAPKVILSRAARTGGTPAVASRWLSRLDVLLQGAGLLDRFRADGKWTHWYNELSRPDTFADPKDPKPKPPVAARPRQLSVTRIETWIRDPYAVYAANILGLRPLDPLDADPGAADRGILVHEALDRFVKTYPGDLPDAAFDELLRMGRDVFNEHLARPGVRAFWWPRFERIAEWFVDYERTRRAAGWRTLAAEAGGEMTLKGPGKPFKLTARADRIDRREGDGLSVIDYKTGQPPSNRQVESGFSPQLPLEAAILAAGGFKDIPSDPVAELVYLHLSGGREAGKHQNINKDLDDLAGDALKGLRDRIARFDDAGTPYLSRVKPMFEGRAGDYDHLARVLEWMAGGGDGET